MDLGSSLIPAFELFFEPGLKEGAHIVMHNMNTYELGKIAVECWGWRWLEGAENRGGCRVVYYDNGKLVWCVDQSIDYDIDITGWIPNLNDEATVGCLRANVRMAWDDPNLSPVYDATTGLWACKGDPVPSELESLVQALRMAPEASESRTLEDIQVGDLMYDDLIKRAFVQKIKMADEDTFILTIGVKPEYEEYGPKREFSRGQTIPCWPR